MCAFYKAIEKDDDFDIIIMLNCDRDYRLDLLEIFLSTFYGSGKIDERTSAMDIGYAKNS